MQNSLGIFYRRSKINFPNISQLLKSLDSEQLFNLTVETLKKKSSERNPNDIALLQYTTKDIGFFKELIQEHGEEIHINCCRHMEGQQFNEQETIFHKGEIGDKFYIILKGKVAIQMPVQTISKGIVFQEVNTLSIGASFGELALLTNQPRHATVKCKEKSFFAVLYKEDFRHILYNIQNKEITQQTYFLESITLFQNFTMQTLRTLIYHFSSQTFNRKEIIFKENDEPDNFYIIKSGQVMLSKTFELFSKNVYLANRLKKRRQVAEIGPGEIFGELECILDENRHFQAEALSKIVVVYKIKKQDFLRRVLVHNQNKDVKEFLSQYIADKIEWRNKRIIQIINLLALQQKGAEEKVLAKEQPNRLEKTTRSRISSFQQTEFPYSDYEKLEKIAEKKKNIFQIHGSYSHEQNPYNLIESYEQKSGHLQIQLRKQIEQCEKKMRYISEKKTDTFVSDKTFTPSTRKSPHQRQIKTEQEESRVVVSRSTSLEGSQSDFYQRLKQKAKLKQSWKRNFKLYSTKNSSFQETVIGSSK